MAESAARPTIVTGLSLRITGIVLVALIDEAAGTVRIVRQGDGINGNAAAVERARRLLAGMVKMTRPDLVLVEE